MTQQKFQEHLLLAFESPVGGAKGITQALSPTNLGSDPFTQQKFV